ncbi:MFS transporter [Thalassobacillus hwangdonensis]|uniref:MFS transporter n=1 Tax=Thalassobacillus hwangdonensis TaxID=546108 RepID=A0ABW3L0D6_9BACI
MAKANVKRNMGVIVTNQFLTALADSIYDVVIFWYVYEQTQSALFASFITAISFVTQIILGPFIGVFVDRREPKRAMQLGFLIMVLVGLSVSLFYFYLNDYFIILLYLGVILHEIGMVTVGPAKNKLLPRIVGMERIVQVSGYISSTSQVSIILGKSLSGFLIAAIGFIGVMLTHSVVYIVASLLLNLLIVTTLHNKDIVNESAAAMEKKQFSSYVADLKDAFKLMRSHRPLYKLIWIGMVLNVASVIGPLFVVIVQEQYGAGAVVFGWFHTIGACAGILVGLFAKNIVNSLKPYLVFGISITLAGVTILTVGTLTDLYSGMAVYFIMTFCLTVFNIAFSSLMITLVQDEYRGRVKNLMGAIAAFMIPAVSIIGGYVADQSSASFVYVIAGIWVSLWGSLIFFDKDIRTIKEIG